ncbi:hypothetical protein [Streptomyces sp. NPDC059708]
MNTGLVGVVTDAYRGRPSRDDATVRCLDWRGPHSWNTPAAA